MLGLDPGYYYFVVQVLLRLQRGLDLGLDLVFGYTTRCDSARNIISQCEVYSVHFEFSIDTGGGARGRQRRGKGTTNLPKR